MSGVNIVVLRCRDVPYWVLGLLLIACLAGCNAITPPPPTALPSMSPIDVLHKNMETLNAEDVAGYMRTIHPQSPGYAETGTLLAQMVETYDLSTSLADVRLESETADEARIYAVVTTRKLRGPDFNNNRVDAIFVLRKDGSEWKIYTQSMLGFEMPEQ